MRHLLAQGPVKSDADVGWDFIAGVICAVWQGHWESWMCWCVHPADQPHLLSFAHADPQDCLDAQHEKLFIFCDLRDNLKNRTFGKLPLMVISKTPVGSDK